MSMVLKIILVGVLTHSVYDIKIQEWFLGYQLGYGFI